MSLLWATLQAIILIEALVPDIVDKGEVSDQLRMAAYKSGCLRPVVSIESPTQKYFHITVTCRDDSGEVRDETPKSQR
jgi:hypothetical protein